jgi:hypothetical protein
MRLRPSFRISKLNVIPAKAGTQPARVYAPKDS